MANTIFSETLIIIREYCNKLTEIDEALASPLLKEYHIAEYEGEKAAIENRLEKIIRSYGVSNKI